METTHTSSRPSDLLSFMHSTLAVIVGVAIAIICSLVVMSESGASKRSASEVREESHVVIRPLVWEAKRVVESSVISLIK